MFLELAGSPTQKQPAKMVALSYNQIGRKSKNPTPYSEVLFANMLDTATDFLMQGSSDDMVSA